MNKFGVRLSGIGWFPLAVISAVLLVGCGSDAEDRSETRGSDGSLAEVQRFKGFALYWLGEAHSDLALDRTTINKRTGPQISFLYGPCEDPEPSDETGCSWPLEVQNYPSCYRNLDSIDGVPRSDRPLKRVEGPGSALTVAFSRTAVEVYTGRTTVAIFATTSDQAIEAARALHSVHGATATSNLPRPAPGALRGELKCGT